jgi:hypothetical protein
MAKRPACGGSLNSRERGGESDYGQRVKPYICLICTCQHPLFAAEKRDAFRAFCQENIVDIARFDSNFRQCLQGFRVLKISVIMTCTSFAVYAIMQIKAKCQIYGKE